MKLAPVSVTCPACGKDIRVPVLAEGPHTNEKGRVTITLTPDVSKVIHFCGGSCKVARD